MKMVGEGEIERNNAETKSETETNDAEGEKSNGSEASKSSEPARTLNTDGENLKPSVDDKSEGLTKDEPNKITTDKDSNSRDVQQKAGNKSKIEQSTNEPDNDSNVTSAKSSTGPKLSKQAEKLGGGYPKPPASRQSSRSTISGLGPRLNFRKTRLGDSENSESTDKADGGEPWKYSVNNLTSRLHPLGRPKIPYDFRSDGPFHRSFVNINATLKTPKLPPYNARKEVYAKEKIDRSPMVPRILVTIAQYEKARDVREIRFRYTNTFRRPRSHGWPNLPTATRQSDS